MEENNGIICENCYEENEITRNTCKNCGEKLYKNNIEKNIKENINEKTFDKVKETSNYKEKYYYTTQNNNKTATALKFIGYLEIICGFILGIVLGNVFEIERGYYYSYKEFNTGLCVGCIVAGIITGIFILGFGEIIQKLQNIEDNTRK